MTMASELSKLASLKKQMEKWQMEMDSELTVSQRISEKTQYDKAKLVEEKRKLVGLCLNMPFSTSVGQLNSV